MPSEARFWLEKLRELPPRRVKLMEVCGTHTMAIARAGIRSLLPEGAQLLSGPGCPVCVTPAEVIDAVLELAMEPGIVVASYGDMLRVPGSRPGDSLQRRRALGARVELVYSPVDAVALAAKNPDKELVFLGVGFETTAPGTAAAVETAAAEGVKNFSVWSMLKTVEPALRALIAQPDFAVQGFLCPGHVATVIGAEGFRFLPEEYGLPAVVGGFEPEEILHAVWLLLKQLASGEAKLENAYPRAVKPQGNPLARAQIDRCLAPRADRWRGLGLIEGSGLGWREEFAAFDAEKKFGVVYEKAEGKTPCRCGEVICGRCRPADCPLFGRRCTPEDPVGPCMVSSEGACAAAYKYRTVEEE
ncbi:MAG: hydrogenase formation protein HypD [Oscillospiraceae bacterium]|nr:hydrogenase formation protein HypD [Oscillospiraceae bacterium]